MSDHKHPPGYIPLTMHELGGVDGTSGKGGRRQRPTFGDDFYYGDSSDFSTRQNRSSNQSRRSGAGGDSAPMREEQRGAGSRNGNYHNGRQAQNAGSRRRRKGRRGGRNRSGNAGPMRPMDDQEHFRQGNTDGAGVGSDYDDDLAYDS